MIAAPLHIGGQRLLLDPSGAVFWPDAKLLAVSDLHLEKGTAMAARGQLAPPWDTRVTLDRLWQVLHRYKPERLVLLGDSFHDRHGSTRMQPADLARLRVLADMARFTWILGNHDPVAPDLPHDIPGDAMEELVLGKLVFRHQARAGSAGELSGHHHPKARVPTRAGPIARPCFVTDSRRIVLPAFGAYTGGLDVRHPAIAGLFPRGGRVFLLGKERLFSFTLAQQREMA